MTMGDEYRTALAEVANRHHGSNIDDCTDDELDSIHALIASGIGKIKNDEFGEEMYLFVE
jgi:hypothetical protein